MTRYAIIAGLILMVVGCTTQMTPQDTARYLSRNHPIGIDVAIGPKLATLEDKASHMGSSVVVPTGTLVKRWFHDKSRCSRQLDLLSSRLTFETRDEFPLPIFHSRADYHISCMLIEGEKRIPVSGIGTGKSGLDAKDAIIQAIDGALGELAGQIALIMSLTEK